MVGLAAGLLLVLPGSQFKNYIQLAQAANTACLVFWPSWIQRKGESGWGWWCSVEWCWG
jgi:hypothetical protein